MTVLYFVFIFYYVSEHKRKDLDCKQHPSILHMFQNLANSNKNVTLQYNNRSMKSASILTKQAVLFMNFYVNFSPSKNWLQLNQLMKGKD